MSGDVLRAIVLGISGVIGLAIVSVLVSQRAQTSGVIGAATSGFAQIIGAATSPVTGSQVGNSTGNNTSVGTGDFLGSLGLGSNFAY